MNEWTTVAKVGDVTEGRGEAFPLEDKIVAVFLVEGKYYAINDMCPHMGASLAEGEVCDCIVACPWHHWRFRIDDGTWCDNPRIRTDAYDVRIVDDQIQVKQRGEKE